jgi:hypothetical protein
MRFWAAIKLFFNLYGVCLKLSGSITVPKLPEFLRSSGFFHSTQNIWAKMGPFQPFYTQHI